MSDLDPKSVGIEVYVTMPNRHNDVKRMIRKREVDVCYVGYPVDVFVNKKLVYSTETEESGQK